MAHDLATKLHKSTTTFHLLGYFSPEIGQRFKTHGLDDFTTYFAARAAPMGAVTPEVTAATFYNFNPAVVSMLTSDVWEKITPAEAVALRHEAITSALSGAAEALNESELDEAIATTQEIVDSLTFGGRALAAGTASVPLPDDKATRLWQLVAIIREWRGDNHIALLVTAGLDAVECLVMDAVVAKGTTSFLKTTRGWSDEEWGEATARLHKRGLVSEDGTPTQDGIDMRLGIESATDDADMPLWDLVGEKRALDLHESLKKVIAALIEDGAYGRYGAEVPE
jgi:Helix-turn-helix family